MSVLSSSAVQLGGSKCAPFGRRRLQSTADTLNIPSGETFPNKLISIWLAGLVGAEWFLSATLSRCPTVGSDICFLTPSIGSNVFLCRFGVSVAGYIAGTLASGDLMRTRRPCLERGWGDRSEWEKGGGGGRIILLTFKGDLKVCERQTLEHLFAWGHWSVLPALRFGPEYKASFPLLLGTGLFWQAIRGDVIKSSSAQ